MVNTVKEKYSNAPRDSLFWKMVVSKGVTLISSAELAASDVTPQQAQKFLMDDEVEVVEVVEKKVEAEEDDMFGEME